MRISFLVRKYHKWLALILGVQALIWLISGVYMVSIDLGYIRGDTLVQKMNEPISVPYEELIPMGDIQQRYENIEKIELTQWLDMPHYRVRVGGEMRLIDAKTGEQRSPLSEEDAIRLAQYHYTASGNVRKATLLTDQATSPSELYGRPLPLWQVNFDDAISTNFYVDPNDGRMVTRRHELWRIFDFFWMLHIMDYEDRTDVNNLLLVVSSFLGLLLSVSGLWLLFYSFKKRKAAEGEAL